MLKKPMANVLDIQHEVFCRQQGDDFVLEPVIECLSCHVAQAICQDGQRQLSGTRAGVTPIEMVWRMLPKIEAGIQIGHRPVNDYFLYFGFSIYSVPYVAEHQISFLSSFEGTL